MLRLITFDNGEGYASVTVYQFIYFFVYGVTHLIDVWAEVEHSVIDDAVDQQRRRLQACLRAAGEHFEYPPWHILVKNV